MGECKKSESSAITSHPIRRWDGGCKTWPTLHFCKDISMLLTSARGIQQGKEYILSLVFKGTCFKGAHFKRPVRKIFNKIFSLKIASRGISKATFHCPQILRCRLWSPCPADWQTNEARYNRTITKSDTAYFLAAAAWHRVKFSDNWASEIEDTGSFRPINTRNLK